MIHDALNEMASVPEELYNLTQLADVTLAAGKLSTTNIQKIKEYIKNEDIMPTQIETNHLLPISKMSLIKRCNSSDVSDSPNTMDSPQKIFSDSGYISDLECTEKKTFLYAMHSHQSQSLDNDVPMSESSITPIKIHSLSEQRQSSFSSSEDDSTYNYSHKIFDKRKSRKLHYQSDNLRNTSKITNAFNHNTMNSIETEDSMLSISESESNEDDPKQKTIEQIATNATNQSHSLQSLASKLINTEAEMTLKSNGSDDVHTCPECGKKYSTSSNLARHRQTHRSLLDKKARRCPHCDKGRTLNSENHSK